jgi:hypothetical protein
MRALLLAAAVAALAGCTATKLDGAPPGARAARQLQIGSLRGGYAGTLALDAARDAESFGVAQALRDRIETWMRDTGRWGGDDVLSVDVDRFRFAGPASGADYLGADVLVTEVGAPSARFHVEHALGAADRSIDEAYSRERALQSLIDAVAWSIVHAVTPFEQRRAIFEIGKQESVSEAIDMLERCGELSYTEALEYGLRGKMSASNELTAEYRRVKRLFGARPPRCY